MDSLRSLLGVPPPPPAPLSPSEIAGLVLEELKVVPRAFVMMANVLAASTVLSVLLKGVLLLLVVIVALYVYYYLRLNAKWRIPGRSCFEAAGLASIDPLLMESATTMAFMIKAGQITSRQLIDMHIAHIERVNPHVNAAVCTRFADARMEADAVDAVIKATPRDRRGYLPPFFGVPCTVKECIALEGLPQTSGLVSRVGMRAQKDAPVVHRMRVKGGLIPLATTNTSELCMWMESDNKVYGCTNNPYHLARLVGGSSGGEGAAIAALFAPVGVGSDIGGSIRMPCFFNGIHGLAPSSGLVPNTDQYPIAQGEPLEYLRTGPMARHAIDIEPLLDVMKGEDGVCASAKKYHAQHAATGTSFPRGRSEDVDLRDTIVYSIRTNGMPLCTPSDDLVAAQRRAEQSLSARGARVVTDEHFDLPFRYSLHIWANGMNGNPVTYNELLSAGRGRVRPLFEFVRWFFGRSEFTFASIGLAFLEMFVADDPAVRRMERDMKSTLDALLGPGDTVVTKEGAKPRTYRHKVLLFPSYTMPAPPHGTPILYPVQYAYTAIFNVMRLPVMQVPLGLNADGLPLGVQVAAAEAHDHVSIAVAKAIEASLGGYRLPRLASE